MKSLKYSFIENKTKWMKGRIPAPELVQFAKTIKNMEEK
jgi:hypothetical protein